MPIISNGEIIKGVKGLNKTYMEKQQQNPLFKVCIGGGNHQSRDIVRHNHYRAHPKLVQGTVSVCKIKLSCESCKINIIIPWDTKTKCPLDKVRY